MLKYLALLLVLSLPGWGWLGRVRAYNEALAQAQAAYRHGDPTGTAAAYQRALQATAAGQPAEPRLLLNLAQAEAQTGRLEAARANYGRVLSSSRAPAALGSVARQQLAILSASQGQYAQAIGLLRQALLLDPTNAGARYNYEVLRDYLARQPAPLRQPGAAGATPPKPTSAPPKPSSPTPSPTAAGQKPVAQPQPATRPGTDRPGQVDDAARRGLPPAAPQPQANANGQPNHRSSPTPGTAAAGSFGTGNGTPRAQPAGLAGGAQRGANESAPGTQPPANRPARPGTEAATDADQQFQTQRERLRQLNLTPAQARQLLEALRAQEAQYLQQRPRPAGRRLKPGEPTW